jgi:putative transport protein
MNFIADISATQSITQAAIQSTDFWITKLLHSNSVAQAVVLMSLTIIAGLWLGNRKVAGIGLGIAGVLFSGLIVGHFMGRMEIHIEDHVLEFVREFGLILFVYSIGVQVGPGFLASLRRDGLPLNIMAAMIVLIGTGITIILHLVFKIHIAVAAGMFSGATTNTPSLAAAQQAIKEAVHSSDTLTKMPGLGYAVCYPFGIIGIILCMLLIRKIFRIAPQKEIDALSERMTDAEQLTTLNLEVRNPSLAGVMLADVPTLADSGVVVSRVMHDHTTQVARSDTILQLGDVLHAVGTSRRLSQLKLIIGQEAAVDLKTTPSNIVSRRVLVTQASALGKTISALNLLGRFKVNVTRVNRAGVDLSPVPSLQLQFADSLLVVGDATGVANAATEVGNSIKVLNHPQILPIFIGIALGVLLGSWPISVPGMPAPIKLGLAGGPLIVAIILSRLGRIGPVVWYLPQSANVMLREMGIVLFLAAVGLKSGDQFVPTLIHGDGIYWMLGGAFITLVPLLIVGCIGRAIYKINYMTLCGLLAGSMTDPPALAFATTLNNSDAPSVSYATVYPMTMILRVLCAQAMVMYFMS